MELSYKPSNLTVIRGAILSLTAAEDIESDRARIATLHQQNVERATYEAKLAQRRYEEVDPSNRLVASVWEKRWEETLRNQRKNEEELNRFRQQQPDELTPHQRQAIKDLSNSLRSLWNSEQTSANDRQDHDDRTKITLRIGRFEGIRNFWRPFFVCL